jgi:hypothetical protein
MNLQQIKQAVEHGHIVCWINDGNVVQKVNDDLYVVYNEQFGTSVDLVLAHNQLCGYEADFYTLCSKQENEPPQLVLECPHNPTPSFHLAK